MRKEGCVGVWIIHVQAIAPAVILISVGCSKTVFSSKSAKESKPNIEKLVCLKLIRVFALLKAIKFLGKMQ